MTEFVHKDADPGIRVALAAAWLDRAYPNWWKPIDLDDFDMGDHDRCIGGYNAIDWDYDLRARYEEETGHSGSGLFSWFTDEWTSEIVDRKEGRK